VRIAAFLMPFFALFAGGFGFVLRRLELRYVFDSATGLPQRGAPITYTLIGLTVLFIIISLVFTIVTASRNKSPAGFENAFGTDPLTYPVILSVIGAIWLAATVFYFLDMRSDYTRIPISEMLFMAMSALSAVSAGFFAVEMYQDPRRKSVYALSIVPTLFMCFWLVLLYNENASNPILLSYAYICLAIIASAMGFYYTSGFVYGKPAPGRAAFAYLTAIFFCFITLADPHHMMIRVVFVAVLAINVLYCFKLLRNLQAK